MKDNSIILKICGAAYVMFLTGLAAGEVGQTSTPSVFSWWLPIEMFVVVGFPLFVGYLAGTEEPK